MEDWELDDVWEWEDFEDYQGFLHHVAARLADQIFLSDSVYLPNDMEDYNLGHLDPEDWWPVVNQLDEIVDLEAVVDVLEELDDLLGFPGLPTELLEAPLAFLSSALADSLPREPSGRKVGSRRLVKIAQAVIGLLEEFPDTAQAAMRAWADVHRSLEHSINLEDFDDEEASDLLFSADLPPAMNGFSMMIGLTLMRWPQRAEGLPLPPDFADPDLYDQVLAQWLALPKSPMVTDEGTGQAEALFAQGQLAHMLAQTGTVELMASDEIRDEDMSLAYSRLSRAILWVHDQCRNCPERDGVTCKAATNWPERPAPLLDIASEIANTARIAGCIRM
jgi:hypothetical protein